MYLLNNLTLSGMNTKEPCIDVPLCDSNLLSYIGEKISANHISSEEKTISLALG